MSTQSSSDEEQTHIEVDPVQITEEILKSVDRYLAQKSVQLEKKVYTRAVGDTYCKDTE